ncbi:hypothetical protein N3K66_004565 [Trichothecium roseum]|uniref:Uncharacterized protein n=1 Tax=Trichothecium roseum TaxID=47278 RepID=A0ACC0V3M2_9HYPO|nr:hypothetical protein N3K66_004565 [Trichothecium roseum]
MSGLKTLALSLLGALAQASGPPASSPPRELFRIEEKGSFLENLVIRPGNGDVLVTRLDVPGIYSVTDPSSSSSFPFSSSSSSSSNSSAPPKLLTAVPGVQHVLGITPVEILDGRETYVVVGGDFDASVLPMVPVPGSSRAFALSFDAATGEAALEHVSTLSPSSRLVNGAAAVPGVPGVVLVADSQAGTVGRLDVSAGTFDAEAFPPLQEMAPVAGASVGLGVNGVRVHRSHLYWTNTDLVSIYRLALTPEGLPRDGDDAAAELVVDLSGRAVALDDFDFSGGDIIVTTNLDHQILRVAADTGAVELVMGSPNETTVAGCTSLKVGGDGGDVVYVATTQADVDGHVVPARLLAFELDAAEESSSRA